MRNIDLESLVAVDPKVLAAKTGEYQGRFPQAMMILEAGGVHPERSTVCRNPYLPNQPEDPEDFRNVGRHCVAVANLAEKLSSDPQVTKIALIHDANKRLEVMRKKAAKVGALGEADVYSGQAYEAIQEKLKGSGIAPELLQYLAVAGKETGHNSLPSFVSVGAEDAVILNPQRSDAEKVVHIVDDMTSSSLPGGSKEERTYYVTCAERMALSDFPNRYRFLYVEGFGFDADGRAVLVKNVTGPEVANLRHVKTYAQWQVLVAGLIANDLQQKIDPSNRQDPELFLCDRANIGS